MVNIHRWDKGNNGHAIYAEMTKPNLSEATNNLNRQDQYTIFQFRTGNCKLKYHINRINPKHPPLCRICPSPYESVYQVLLDCQDLQEIRNKLLPRNPTINDTLYGNTTEQLRKTCNFVKLSFKLNSNGLVKRRRIQYSNTSMLRNLIKGTYLYSLIEI